MSEEQEEGGNLITEKMIKMATFYIHELARRRGADFKDIQKKCKRLLGYENLAKVSLEDGHVIINKLIELTGGKEKEEQEPEELKDDLSPEWSVTVEDAAATTREATKPKNEEKEDSVITIMRESVRAAVDITQKEVVDKEIPVMGLGGFVLRLTEILFEAKIAAREKGKEK